MLKLKNLRWLALIIVPLIFISCHTQKPDNQVTAERFLQIYYLNIDPQGALAITQGPANKKMQREVELLRGVGPPATHETPKMQYKVLRCRLSAADKSQCDYEIHIEGNINMIRRGQVTLRKVKGKWGVTQFVEELGK